jgi:hypothetical protein
MSLKFFKSTFKDGFTVWIIHTDRNLAMEMAIKCFVEYTDREYLNENPHARTVEIVGQELNEVKWTSEDEPDKKFSLKNVLDEYIANDWYPRIWHNNADSL